MVVAVVIIAFARLCSRRWASKAEDTGEYYLKLPALFDA